MFLAGLKVGAAASTVGVIESRSLLVPLPAAYEQTARHEHRRHRFGASEAAYLPPPDALPGAPGAGDPSAITPSGSASMRSMTRLMRAMSDGRWFRA